MCDVKNFNCHDVVIKSLIFLSLLPFGLGINEECLGLEMCKQAALLIGGNNASIHECQNFFNCETDSTDDSTKTYFNQTSVAEPRSITASTMWKIVKTKAIRKPKSSYNHPRCRKCERKRSKCTTYYIYTYGLCTAAWLISGRIGSWGCNLITLPRTVDCTLNTIFNCYLKNCGLIGL